MISRSQILLFAVFVFGIITLFIYPYFDTRIPVTFKFDNYNKEFQIRTLAVAADFNGWATQGCFLSDPDSDHIWTATIPLQPGNHSYRFVLNNERWLRDPGNPQYTGPYSNSLIYADSIEYPFLLFAEPNNGSWIYSIKDTAYFIFNCKIDTLAYYKIRVLLDGQIQNYSILNNRASILLSYLSEGEHHWQIFIINNRLDTVYQKTAIWYVNSDNLPPVAEAGYTGFGFKNQLLKLNGGQSYDPDMDVLSFHWDWVSGPARINLKNADTPFPEFKTPIPGNYRFRLSVIDSLGAEGYDYTEIIILDDSQALTQFRYEPGKNKELVKQVSVAGEFNQWNPEANPMTWNDDSLFWETDLPLEKGKYEYKFVINNNRWIIDPKNPDKFEDGWQGFNSIKTVQSLFDFQPELNLDSIPEFNGQYEVSVNGLPDDGYGQWYADINNPVNRIIQKENTLVFNKSFPAGIYYYYFISRAQEKYTKPLTLLVNHFENTRFSDLSVSPAWPDTSIVYELFVRRFTKEGTFNGLIEKLPYLKALGINVLWLMPVYEGPTEHGYAPTQLFNVEHDYGSISDYQKLIDSAHKMGMKVIFDFVANHLSDQHRFVQAAADDLNSPLRSWFYWQSNGTWDYHNDWDTLVNLNFNNPQVRHLILDAGRFWLGLGVDGFRCDVAWAVPHNFWKDFRRAIKEINPDCLIIDEVLPRQPAYHFNEFDMSYDTDFYGNILDVLQDKKSLSALDYGLKKTEFNYPPSAKNLRYIENHDLERFVKMFGEKRTKLMAALLFTVPGTPLLYYGQEYGMQKLRPNYPEHPNSNWVDFYTELIKLRKEMPELTLGKMETVDLDNSRKLWHFRRIFGSEVTDVYINLSKQDQKIILPENVTKIYFKEKNLFREDSVYYLNAESFIMYKSGN
jgi:glycosidase